MLSGCVLRGFIERVCVDRMCIDRMLPALGSPDNRARVFSTVLIRSIVGAAPRRDTAKWIPISTILSPSGRQLEVVEAVI